MQITQLIEFVRCHSGGSNGVVIAIALGVAVVFSWSSLKSECKKNVQLPPGPVPLPEMGNLHLLGRLPHRGLTYLARRYGPVMFLHLGSMPSLIVYSPEMAKLILKTHDQNFATRPPLSFGRNISYGSKILAFSVYCSYWKEIRKIVSSQLLGPKSLDSLKYMRGEEMQAMVDGAMDHCNNSVATPPLNVSKLAFDVAMYMSCRIKLGKKYSEKELASSSGVSKFNFNQLVQEFFYLGGTFNISDFIPWLQWL